MSAEEIVRYFYGDDINFVRNAPIAPNLGGSWPGETLRLGDVSEEVRIIQNRLNRISTNYPEHPQDLPGGRHLRRGHRARGARLPAAVQPDRGRHRRPRDLVPHRVHLQQRQAPVRAGQRGPAARRGLPPVPGRAARGRVRPGRAAAAILPRHRGRILRPAAPLAARTDRRHLRPADARGGQRPISACWACPKPAWSTARPGTSWSPPISPCSRSGPHRNGWTEAVGFPDIFLVEGMRGEAVREAQQLINVIARGNPQVPTVAVDGIFGSATRDAVSVIQSLLGLPATRRDRPADLGRHGPARARRARGRADQRGAVSGLRGRRGGSA